MLQLRKGKKIIGTYKTAYDVESETLEAYLTPEQADRAARKLIQNAFYVGIVGAKLNLGNGLVFEACKGA